MMTIKPGSKAPTFKLENQNGELKTIKDFEEDYLVLFFYPKDNTPGCTLEAQGFTQLQNKFKKLSAKPIGISGGDTKSKQKFCLKAKLDITLLSDSDGSIGVKYGAYGEKKFMGRTSIGFLRKTFIIGPDRSIIKIYESVKAASHPEEVLEFIQGL